MSVLFVKEYLDAEEGQDMGDDAEEQKETGKNDNIVGLIFNSLNASKVGHKIVVHWS